MPKCFPLLLTIFYGILIEILQATVFIHRSGDIRDAIANSIGAFVGLWVFGKMAKKVAGKG
ncbi:MAG: VanZ family protein [Bacteroidetes bacterium]|nr:VanZ family protein [Bacteroidota bacterium]